MNNLSSYCGLVDAKIRAPDKDLPVTTSDPSLISTLLWESSFFEVVGVGFFEIVGVGFFEEVVGVGFFEADGVGSLNNIVLDVDAQGPTSNWVYLICSIHINCAAYYSFLVCIYFPYTQTLKLNYCNYWLNLFACEILLIIKSWLLLPHHQSTYPRGPESASIEIPSCRPKFTL